MLRGVDKTWSWPHTTRNKVCSAGCKTEGDEEAHSQAVHSRTFSYHLYVPGNKACKAFNKAS